MAPFPLPLEACPVMTAFSSPAFLHLVRASAVYDLAVTAPFATPWSFAALREQLSAANVALGGAPLPAFEPFHVLFACLLGSVVLVWSALRIAAPSVRLGRFDAAARALFSAWLAWALAATGAPLLWVFLLPEAAWGALQAWPVRRVQPRAPGPADGQARWA